MYACMYVCVRTTWPGLWLRRVVGYVLLWRPGRIERGHAVWRQAGGSGILPLGSAQQVPSQEFKKYQKRFHLAVAF